MRAIDADKLKEHIDKLPALPDGNFAGTHRNLKALINMQPTIEPERKKGKWGNHGECPFCSYLRQWEDDRFCGNCGADMRGKKE